MPPPSSALKWGTATFMVTVVSCCSLVGVSILPLISGPSYKTFITMFTGLAVGSLLGSAIFSLIPQAFGLHLHSDKAYLWKSLIIFLGIYLFYCSERFMKIYFDRKERRRSSSRQSEQVQLKRTKSNDSNCDLAHEQTKAADGGDVPNTSSANTTDSNQDKTSGSPATSTELSLMHDRRAEPADEDESAMGHQHNHSHGHHQHNNHNHHGHDAIHSHEVIRKALKGERLPATTTTVSKLQRDRIAPLAWMIIIGDGLHNFIDGLSIGAAFSESIYQGMIICVAVIFEELPHELGDFAVLISSGMTVKQALGFNFLSACTCYIGMVCGILLGEMAQSASYIFALAAGMFFYISLVDMMGELTAALEECRGSTKESTHLLLMQNIGILFGIIIIFSLSLLGPGA